jgi:predicted NACHT family NTPase
LILLLDGYDEVSHKDCLTANGKYNIKKVLDEIYKNDKITFIITSRPNAITNKMQKKFDRKLKASEFN